MSNARALQTSSPVPVAIPDEVQPPLLDPSPWSLRVSRAPGSRDPNPLLVHRRELVGVLLRLLEDESVHGIAIARRTREVHAQFASRDSILLTHGTLTVDLAARDARVGGERVPLTRLEFDLLVFFLQNPNRAISRGELLRSVWQSEATGEGRTVDIHVRRLRSKFARIPFPLEALVKVGYRFTVGSD